MVAGAFPVLKLGTLAIRQVSKMTMCNSSQKVYDLSSMQVSKPLVNYFKARAKNSSVFRSWVCLPVAQLYHKAETTSRMLMMGLGKPKSIAPLNEQMAVSVFRS